MKQKPRLLALYHIWPVKWFTSDVENDAKLCTFWPAVKLAEGWVRSLYQLLKLYLRP